MMKEAMKEAMQEGMKEMGNGETTYDIGETLDYGIESVSIRQGCQLVIDTGK